MKFIKSKLFIFILGGIFFSSITALAVTTISADKITYTDKNNVEKTVDVVLDDLYDKANSSRIATEVATITTATRANTYTMQHDGYITGTVARSCDNSSCSSYSGAFVRFTKDNVSRDVIIVDYRNTSSIDTSLYATAGTTISVRSDAGTYNLTIYEWK